MRKKIIIDTNWWIAFIVSGSTGNLPVFFISDKIDIYFSRELLHEIKRTLEYKRVIKRVNKFNYEKFLDFIEESAVMFETVSTVAVCRDPKDNFLLALAKDAGADYLITRDNDLLVLDPFENTSIITLNKFTEILNQSS